jgi:oligosaccharyltransferase complex subunit epsilon
MPPKSSVQPSAPNAFHSLWKAYNDNTSDRLKFIDAFLFFLMLSGIVQFAYCVLVSNFPYNAFLAGYVYHLTRLRRKFLHVHAI